MYTSSIYRLFLCIPFILPSLHAESTSRVHDLTTKAFAKVNYYKSCLMGEETRTAEEIYTIRRNIGIAGIMCVAGTMAIRRLGIMLSMGSSHHNSQPKLLSLDEYLKQTSNNNTDEKKEEITPSSTTPPESEADRQKEKQDSDALKQKPLPEIPHKKAASTLEKSNLSSASPVEQHSSSKTSSPKETDNEVISENKKPKEEHKEIESPAMDQTLAKEKTEQEKVTPPSSDTGIKDSQENKEGIISTSATEPLISQKDVSQLIQEEKRGLSAPVQHASNETSLATLKEIENGETAGNKETKEEEKLVNEKPEKADNSQKINTNQDFILKITPPEDLDTATKNLILNKASALYNAFLNCIDKPDDTTKKTLKEIYYELLRLIKQNKNYKDAILLFKIPNTYMNIDNCLYNVKAIDDNPIDIPQIQMQINIMRQQQKNLIPLQNKLSKEKENEIKKNIPSFEKELTQIIDTYTNNPTDENRNTLFIKMITIQNSLFPFTIDDLFSFRNEIFQLMVNVATSTLMQQGLVEQLIEKHPNFESEFEIYMRQQCKAIMPEMSSENFNF